MSRKRWCPLSVFVLVSLWLPVAAHAVSDAERGALIDLYNSTAGWNWVNNSGWNGPPGTECTWYGVICSGDAVFELLLPQNNLSGPIPPSIGQLGSLYALYLDLNQLTGSIPPEIGNLANLDTLSLVSNQLSGPLPPELGSLSRLTVLRISRGSITGTIPASLGNLTGLQDLVLESTQITGPIPPELGNLTQLIRIALGGNQLSGSIPTEIGNLTNLLSLSLVANQLSGEIPSTFLNLTNLFEPDGLVLAFNMLHSDDPTLNAFLATKAQGFGGWRATQTVPPNGLAVSAPSTTSLLVSWNPIDYSWSPGCYVVWYGTTPGGPYPYYALTNSKFNGSWEISGLTPGTTYYFVVRAVSDATIQNSSTLTSEPSVEVSGTTLPDIPPGPPLDTPSGTDVYVRPVDANTGTSPVALYFQQVTQGGSTTLTESASGPALPAGFQLGSPPIYYDISTTAQFTGTVTICIDFTGTGFSGDGELGLLHFENGAWVDITTIVRPLIHFICGTVSSFSPFVVAQRAPLTVRIDIKPDSYPNTLNLRSQGKVPVAVLSSAGFDARRVDPRTVTLAGAPVVVKPSGELMASCEDVDRDGRPDLLLHVETSALRLAPGDTQAALVGETYDGLSIQGTDSVRIVH